MCCKEGALMTTGVSIRTEVCQILRQNSRSSLYWKKTPMEKLWSAVCDCEAWGCVSWNMEQDWKKPLRREKSKLRQRSKVESDMENTVETQNCGENWTFWWRCGHPSKKEGQGQRKVVIGSASGNWKAMAYAHTRFPERSMHVSWKKTKLVQ